MVHAPSDKITYAILLPTMPYVTLKPGKDIPLRAGHPWIFSEAIAKTDSAKTGELVEVSSAKGEFLGIGYINPNTSIRVRMLTLHERVPIDAAFFAARFQKLDYWKKQYLPSGTTGYRLVHAEADGLPGLIVDRYADTLVFQLHTAGMDLLRAEIIQALQTTFAPRVIVERSDVDVRRMEGLSNMPIQTHLGDASEPVTFLENGLRFNADVLKGQKTGFFLDQREARAAVSQLAKGKHVLNLFGYSGAFSVYAAQGGAASVTTVDISEPALKMAENHLRQNGFNPDDETKFEFIQADVLELLDDDQALHRPYDLIICDPPAFAKNAAHVPQAIKAYTELNATCLRRLQPGGILVSSSCSGRIDAETFRNMLRFASGHAKRDTRLIKWIGHAIDHAERLAFPEGRYLKTAILEVERVLG